MCLKENRIVLLEDDEVIRLATRIVAKKQGIKLCVYKDYNEYLKDRQSDDIIYVAMDKTKNTAVNFLQDELLSDAKNTIYYIEKPYTASELLNMLYKGA